MWPWRNTLTALTIAPYALRSLLRPTLCLEISLQAPPFTKKQAYDSSWGGVYFGE